jgi:hypothetical protein
MRFFIQPSINTPSAAPVLGPVEGSPGQLGNTPSEVRANPHLRSANEVQGYAIQAEDGDIGHVKDFLVRQPSWEIRHLVIDTGV